MASDKLASRMSASLIAAAVAAVYLFVTVVVMAHRTPSYSHARHTISELASYGSRYSRLVSLGVFLPVGLTFGVVAFGLRFNPPMAALALSICVGYVLGAAFPCDAGCPAYGSPRQIVHNVGGAIEYFGGAASMMVLGAAAGPAYLLAGLLVAVSAIVISAASRVRGLVQRLAECCLFFGFLSALSEK